MSHFSYQDGVLCAESKRRSLEILDQVADVRQRRQDHQFDAGHRHLGDLPDQGGRERAAAMQFPVTGNDPAAHAVTLSVRA